ncbi:MAG: hypothetical protein PVH17_02325 [Anaerolineae bacterium]|jgi:hypothetical protein
MEAWLALLIGVALSTGIFALLVYLYPKLKTEEQGYPLEAQIEAALLPLVFEAICSAYRMSEQAVDDVGARIRGLDKKKIADSIYRMLPDKIGDFELTLVKNIIPQERFEQLVQDAFDRFDRFFIEHQRHFDELFEAWKAEQAAPPG